jgi:hypothetical protein
LSRRRRHAPPAIPYAIPIAGSPTPLRGARIRRNELTCLAGWNERTDRRRGGRPSAGVKAGVVIRARIAPAIA